MISVKTPGLSRKSLNNERTQWGQDDFLSHLTAAFLSDDQTEQAVYKKHFSLGATDFTVSSSSRNTLNAITQALAHIEMPQKEGTLRITIHCGFSNQSQQFFNQLNALSGNKVVRLQNNRFMFLYNPGLEQSIPTFSFLDHDTGQAVFWVADEQKIPWYGLAAPFRTIFNWFFANQGVVMVHAACIGIGDTGVIIVGRGGKGKTSTALSFLHNKKLSYLADDYVLLDVRSSPKAISLFSSAKIDTASLLRFPELQNISHRPAEPYEKKTVFFFYPDRADQLAKTISVKAIITPNIAQATTTTFRSIAGAQALIDIAPSTIFQLWPENTQNNSFASMATLTKSVPSFEMELSNDPREISQSLVTFLEAL